MIASTLQHPKPRSLTAHSARADGKVGNYRRVWAALSVSGKRLLADAWYNKTAGMPAAFKSNRTRSGQCTDLAVETALITSCLVLVNQTLASHMIKNGNSFFKSSFSSGFITSCNSCEHALDHRSHHRALARVALTGFFSLTNAFPRLSSIGHELSSNLSVQNSAAYHAPGASLRQRPVQ